jgi:hypothetical protein
VRELSGAGGAQAGLRRITGVRIWSRCLGHASPSILYPAELDVLEDAERVGDQHRRREVHADQVRDDRLVPGLAWQPSDASESALAGIAAWLAEVELPNLRAPIALDSTRRRGPVVHADAIVCIDMVHIAWEATLGLFDGAVRRLSPGQ